MFKRIIFLSLYSISLVLLLGHLSLLSAEERITITTYYPSPSGSFNNFGTNKLAVDINNVAVPSEFEQMLNGDAHIGRSLIIGAGGGSGFAFDELAAPPLATDSRPQDGDLIVKNRVSIGTTDLLTPTPSLNLNGGLFIAGGNGDINNDTVINAVDVQLITNYIIRTATPSVEQFARADVNGDGVLDLTDSEIIVNLALGLAKTNQSKVRPFGSNLTQRHYFSLMTPNPSAAGSLHETLNITSTDTAGRHLYMDFNGGHFFAGGNGDINADGSVNAVDTQLIINYILGTNTPTTAAQFAAADTNGDGVINIQDMRNIVRIVLGLAKNNSRSKIQNYGPATNSLFAVGPTNIDSNGNVTTPILTVTNNSRVGINTTTPQATLDINTGNIRMDFAYRSCEGAGWEEQCTCPTGYILVGGGASCLNSKHALLRSYPISRTTWNAGCTLENLTGSIFDPVRVNIICVRAVDSSTGNDNIAAGP